MSNEYRINLYSLFHQKWKPEINQNLQYLNLKKSKSPYKKTLNQKIKLYLKKPLNKKTNSKKYIKIKMFKKNNKKFKNLKVIKIINKNISQNRKKLPNPKNISRKILIKNQESPEANIKKSTFSKLKDQKINNGILSFKEPQGQITKSMYIILLFNVPVLTSE